jgi:hypothetical protein
MKKKLVKFAAKAALSLLEKRTQKLENIKAHIFTEMWNDQLNFLDILISKKKLPQYPVDLKSKSGQQLIRDLLRDAADELHEACLVLKNAKSHRTTEVQEFDRAHFIEEVVDSVKFCLGALIYTNVSIEEFYQAFKKKTETNVQRQKEGY